MEGESKTSREEKTWNQQLAEALKKKGLTPSQALKTPELRNTFKRSTLDDMIYNRTKNLHLVAPKRILALYKLTNLGIFREAYIQVTKQDPKSAAGFELEERTKPLKYGEGLSQLTSEVDEIKKKVDGLVERLTDQLPGQLKLKHGLLKVQRYSPSAEQRADALMEVLDLGAEIVDYFRTASGSERQILVKKLKRNPESYGYLTKMLNVLYKDEGVESWMRTMQPPHRVKKVLGK
jgi:hypothetical protein